MNKQVNHLWANKCFMSSTCTQHVHKHISTLRHLGPTSRAATPLCWWCQPDQRAAACRGHPHPRTAGPLGPPRGVTSGPDLSGTWGDRTQETSATINSSLLSKPRQLHSVRARVSGRRQNFYFLRCALWCRSNSCYTGSFVSSPVCNCNCGSRIFLWMPSS